MQRQGPEQKRWWVDEKFFSCIKQLFFPHEPWWKPWRIRALCLSSQPEWCGHPLSLCQHPRAQPGGQGFALGDAACAESRPGGTDPRPETAPVANTAGGRAPAARGCVPEPGRDRPVVVTRSGWGSLGAPGCKAAPLVCSRERGPALEPSAALACGLPPARFSVGQRKWRAALEEAQRPRGARRTPPNQKSVGKPSGCCSDRERCGWERAFTWL